jgi:hypothetical protein
MLNGVKSLPHKAHIWTLITFFLPSHGIVVSPIKVSVLTRSCPVPCVVPAGVSNSLYLSISRTPPHFELCMRLAEHGELGQPSESLI